MPGEHAIAIFPSTHMALLAERAAREAGILVRMVVVPRRLSPDCNMGMATAMENKDSLRRLLASRNIECRLTDWPREGR